jgi:hypothetical protein
MYDFNAHPIAPYGTKILIYEKPADRKTWAPHGVPGYYLGPAPHTYRGYKVWTSTTQRLRVTNTVEWFPNTYRHPMSDPQDILYGALDNIQRQLNGMATTNDDLHIDEELITETIAPLRRLVTDMINNTSYNSSTTTPRIQVPEQRVEQIEQMTMSSNCKHDSEQRVMSNKSRTNESTTTDNAIATRTRKRVKEYVRNTDTESENDVMSQQRAPINMSMGPDLLAPFIEDEYNTKPYGPWKPDDIKTNKEVQQYTMRHQDEDFVLPLHQKHHPNIKWIKKNKKKIKKQRSPQHGDPSWDEIEEYIKEMATPHDAQIIRQQINQQSKADSMIHHAAIQHLNIMIPEMSKHSSINQICTKQSSNSHDHITKTDSNNNTTNKEQKVMNCNDDGSNIIMMAATINNDEDEDHIDVMASGT